jgi:hypothetical protein
MYRKHKCRCDSCRQARSEYDRDYYARKNMGAKEAAITHGVLGWIDGCRCVLCSLATSAYRLRIKRAA